MSRADTHLTDLRRHLRDAGVGVLLSVACVLAGIHVAVPEPLVSQFVFTYGDPQLVTVWTAAAIHDSPAHFASNLAWYGIVVALAYTLYSIWGRRRLFWLLYGSLLLITPPATVAVDY